MTVKRENNKKQKKCQISWLAANIPMNNKKCRKPLISNKFIIFGILVLFIYSHRTHVLLWDGYWRCELLLCDQWNKEEVERLKNSMPNKKKWICSTTRTTRHDTKVNLRITVWKNTVRVYRDKADHFRISIKYTVSVERSRHQLRNIKSPVLKPKNTRVSMKRRRFYNRFKTSM